MRERLKTALMATAVATSFLTPAVVPAQSSTSSHITATTDESGRRIYVNDGAPAASVSPGSPTTTSTTTVTRHSRFVYWSSTEHRFKPVPTSGAVMRAARSAASEVNNYLDGGSTFPLVQTRPFTQQDVDAAIEQAASRHNVDPNLVRSVIKVESNFNPNAVSRKGAMGLMQLMPATARSLNVSNPFDPQQNVDAGVRHLRKLLDSYGGDIRLSLAAYNAGAGAVARSAGVPHFFETQNYVRRITSLYYGSGESSGRMLGNPVHDPVRVERDARGGLYITNTE